VKTDRRAMSRSSSRMPGASISISTAGQGPPRSGRQTKLGIAPSRVAISSSSLIIRVLDVAPADAMERSGEGSKARALPWTRQG